MGSLLLVDYLFFPGSIVLIMCLVASLRLDSVCSLFVLVSSEWSLTCPNLLRYQIKFGLVLSLLTTHTQISSSTVTCLFSGVFNDLGLAPRHSTPARLVRVSDFSPMQEPTMLPT